MFEHFTGSARRAIVLSQEEMVRLGHDRVASEHLLLGVLREGEGAGALALVELGVTVDAARSQVEAIAGRGARTTSNQAPFSPRAKKALERALVLARRSGSGYVGTGHLLLGTIETADATVQSALSNLGVRDEAVRNRTASMLAEDRASEDRTERSADGSVFRAVLSGIRVAADGAEPLTVDVAYEYGVPEADGRAGTHPHEHMADLLEKSLPSVRPWLPEGVAAAAGKLLLEESSAVEEVTVTVSKTVLAREPGPLGLAVSATFRR